MRAPHISPDGQRLVFITHLADGKPAVAVRDLATKSTNAIFPGEAKQFVVTACRFKTNERLLCRWRGVDYLGGDPIWTTRLLALNVDGSNSKILVQNGRAGAGQFQDQILHYLPQDPAHVLN